MFEKIKNKLKQVLVTILSATTAGTGIAAITNQVTNAADFRLYVENNDESYLKAAAYWNYPSGGTDAHFMNQMPMFYVSDGTQKMHIFCIQQAITTGPNQEYTASNQSAYYNSLSQIKKDKIRAAHYWYYTNYEQATPSQETKEAYIATQWYTWRVTSNRGNSDDESTWDDFNWTQMASVGGADYSGARTKYNTLKTFVDNHVPTYPKPSFTCSPTTIKPGDTITCTDTNGVVSNGEWELHSQVLNNEAFSSVTLNNNNTITLVTKTTIDSGSLQTGKLAHHKVSKGMGSGQDFIFTGKVTNTIQELAALKGEFNDPDSNGGEVTIEAGSIEITKIDEVTEEILPGAKFTLYKGSKTESNKISEKTVNSTTGKAKWEDLSFDTYIIEETGVPANYAKMNDITVTVDGANKDRTVTANNTRKKGTIEVLKIDEVTEEALPNTKFHIQAASDNAWSNLNGEYTTNSEGKIILENIPYGKYEIWETQASPGYQNNNPDYKTISLTETTYSATPKTVTFTAKNNPKLGELTIKKYDDGRLDGSHISLPGTQFRIQASVSNPYSDLNVVKTTNANGEIYIDNLPYGEYVITEITPTNGYVIDNPNPTIVTVDREAVTKNFYDHPATGTVTIDKQDNVTLELLPNTKFRLRAADNNPYSDIDMEITTNAQGKYVTDALPYGDYLISEIEPSKGYNNNNNTEITITVNNSNVNKTFKNKIIQGRVNLTKVNSEYVTDRLQGAVFSVYKIKDIFNTLPEPQFIGDYTTDANGHIQTGLLDYGDYYIVEKQATYGFYNPQTKYYFNIRNEGENITLTDPSSEYIGNTPVVPKVIVTKLDNNSDGYGTDEHGNKLKLQGAKIELWEHVVLRDAWGHFLSETDALIAGPTYTNEDGEAIFNTKLAYSNELQQSGSYYYVKEVEAPYGYLLDETNNTQTISFDYQGQFIPVVEMNSIFENEIIKGKIKVIKVDKENNEVKLPGAVYEIKNKDGVVVDTITTDENGEAFTKDLRVGKYTIHEITAPENYQLDAEDAEVELTYSDEEGQTIVKTQIVEIGNTHNKGTLTIKKVDGLTLNYETTCEDENDLSTCVVNPILTEETTYLPGVKFAIYKKEDLDNPVAEITTDENGKAEILLNTGDYFYQEISAPEGYNINPKLVPFTLENHGDTFEDIFANMFMYGQIKVYKIGEKLEGIKVDENGVTNLVWKEDFMPGTKFTLYADAEIKHPITNKVLYKKDDIVREIITDENGEALVENLPLGKYYVKETVSPEFHSVYDAINDTKYIQLTEEDANFEGIIESEITFKNERVIIDPTIYKQGASLVDVNDESKGYNYAPLAGAKFGVYNTEKITSADEKVTIEPDTLLAIMETDENGFADVEVKLPFGKYYVKEIAAPEGYEINNETYPFELVWNQELQNKAVLNVDVTNKENPITNYKIEVPDTGLNRIEIYTAAGLAIIAISGLAVFINKKKQYLN